MGAEASRDILKFRVSEMAFPGVSKKYFLPQMLCCFVTIHATLIATGKCDGYTPPWAYKIQTGRKRGRDSLPTDVLWGSFVTHS